MAENFPTIKDFFFPVLQVLAGTDGPLGRREYARSAADLLDLSPEQRAVRIPSGQFMEMRDRYPQHYALVVVLVYLGLRFCHASALKWEDWAEDAEADLDEAVGVLKVRRKQVRGQVGPVSRKKRAPRKLPVRPELAEVLRWHRLRMISEQAPGVESGWMFPSSTGTLRAPSSLKWAWTKCLAVAGIDRRVRVHDMRGTFTDLARKAKIDPVTRRALTGHVTEEMQRKYSNVDLSEKDQALAQVFELAPLPRKRGDGCGDHG